MEPYKSADEAKRKSQFFACKKLTSLKNEPRKLSPRLKGGSCRIIASPDPVHPSGKGGVAIVLSKDHFANGDDVEVKEIVPGRALQVRTKWRRNDYITILNVYAPSVTAGDARENKQFWEEIETYYLFNPTHKPDFMLGDFNMVEDAIDRLPTRPDHRGAVDALDNVKLLLDLQDGWRAIHPSGTAYTFSSPQDSHSRIDRIYATQHMIETAREWEIKPATGVPNTDHRMVSVQAVSEDDPLIGKGRWSFPKHLLHDRELSKKINEKGRAALQELARLTDRTDSKNAQTTLAGLKAEIREIARARSKAVVPPSHRKLREIEIELNRVQSNTSTPEAQRRTEISRLKKLEGELEASLHEQVREAVLHTIG